tara:strand:+ start:1507 stop:1632 length:126 start_codon:yes stop_codon:yes gene_type:complete
MSGGNRENMDGLIDTDEARVILVALAWESSGIEKRNSDHDK